MRRRSCIKTHSRTAKRASRADVPDGSAPKLWPPLVMRLSLEALTNGSVDLMEMSPARARPLATSAAQQLSHSQCWASGARWSASEGWPLDASPIFDVCGCEALAHWIAAAAAPNATCRDCYRT